MPLTEAGKKQRLVSTALSEYIPHVILSIFLFAIRWRLLYKTKTMSKANKQTKTKQPAADRFEKMEVIHSHAAGIDVGSRSHFVAIGQGKEDVKEFGVYTEDLHRLCQYLMDAGVTTVAMESTGLASSPKARQVRRDDEARW